MSQQVVTELVIDSDTSGADRFSQSMDKAGGSAERGASSVQSMTLAIAGVSVGTIAAMAALRGFIDFVGSQTQSLVDMSNQAQLAGVSMREFQQMLFAARASGLTEKDFVSGLDRIGADLTAASRGVTEFGRLFEANGLSIRNANGELKTTKQAVADLAGLMQNAAPQTQQAIAKIVGISAAWVPFLKQGVEGIEAQKKAAADLGVIIDDDIINKAREFNTQWKTAVAAWDLQFKASLAGILPLLIQLANIASTVLDAAGRAGSFLSRALTPLEDQSSSDLIKQLAGLEQYRGKLAEVNEEVGFFQRQQLIGRSGAIGVTADADLKTIDAQIVKVKELIEQKKALKRVEIPGNGTVLPPSAANDNNDAVDRAIMSLQKHIEVQKADALAIGLGAGALARFRAEAAETAAVLANGGKETDEQKKRFAELREEAGKTAESLAKLRLAGQIDFANKTKFLSSEDVAIASQLRDVYGNDVPKALASTEAAQLRVINAQKMLSDGFQDVGKSMLSAFLSGKNVMDALVQSLDNLANKLSSAAFDNLLGGLRTGNLAQAGIGALQAGASALISMFTGDQKAKKEVEEAKKAWEAMADQLLAFNRAASGFDLGPLTQELESLRQAHDTLAMAALEARDMAGLNQVHETLNRGIQRIFSEWMNGVPVLGDLSQKIQDLTNEARGLAEAIPDAAAAIDQGLIARINALKLAAEDALKSEINVASGFGWLNDINAAIAKFNDLNGKVDAGTLNTWMTVTLQKIVDDAKLTGEAFQRLITGIPQIAGYIHEYSEALDESGQAALAAAAAQEKATLQLRLLVAQTDQTTLSGALAVNALRQQMEMNDAIAANSQNIALLQQVHAAETYNIQKSFADKAIAEAQRVAEEQQRAAEQAAEAQKRAMEQAQNAFNGFVKNIRDFIAHYLAGPESGLSPQDQLTNAQSAYSSQLALAASGDRDALNSITQYFSDLVKASDAYYASSAAGQSIKDTALSQLQALPSQISPEQFIVDAIEASSVANVDSLDAINLAITNSLIAAVNAGNATAFATALLPHFNALLDPTTGLLKQAQLETKLNLPTGALSKIFTEIDTNNDGQVTREELTNKILKGTETGPLVDTADNTNDLEVVKLSVQALSDPVQLLALAQVSGNTASTANLLNNLYNLLSFPYQSSNVGVWGNLRQLVSQGGGTPVATGGLINGPGTGTSDSINARLSNGEFVLRSAAAAGIGYDKLFYMNDNARMPPVSAPSFASFGGGDNSALIAEVRALRGELAEIRGEMRRNTAVAAEGHQGTIDKLDEANALRSDSNRARRRGVAA